MSCYDKYSAIVYVIKPGQDFWSVGRAPCQRSMGEPRPGDLHATPIGGRVRFVVRRYHKANESDDLRAVRFNGNWPAKKHRGPKAFVVCGGG
jgi:hypothetical protein